MKKIFFLALCCSAAAAAHAFDLWQHPEVAERNSLFVAVAGAELAIVDGVAFNLAPRFNFDYMLPVRFPFSLGAFVRVPEPNLNSFGARLGYHINLDSHRTNLYFMYVFDFGFIRNELLELYGDEPVPMRRFDFRAGVRHRIGHFLFVQIEADFQFRGIVAGLALRLF